jgi:hypothetical protein
LSGYEFPAISKRHNVGSNFGQKIEKEYENLIYIFVSFVILFCVMDNQNPKQKKANEKQNAELI